MNSETVSTPGGFVRATGTEAQVCKDIARRQAMGTAKYGTTVRENPLALKAWLQHQYEELLDAAIYCKRTIEEIEKKEEGWCNGK